MIGMVNAGENDPVDFGNTTDVTVWVGGADGMLWSTVGNTLYVNGTQGNVGIGTVTPAVPLDVHQLTTGNDILRLLDTGKDGRFNVVARGGVDGQMEIVNYNGSAYKHLDIQGSKISMGVSGDETDFNIDSAGKVGIGTTSPSSPLEIHGTGAFATSTRTTKPTLFIGMRPSGGTAALDFGTNITDGLRIENYNGITYFYSITNTNTFNERMTLNGVTGVVNVVGEFTAGTKTFTIDNPENPLNEKLRHVNVENPEAIVNYRGTSESYNNGQGWNYTVIPLGNNQYKIQLPSWFDDLTFTGDNYNEYTGMLSGLKGFCGDSYFDFSDVGKNEFAIVTENLCEFSWDIKAVRHDPFYENHKVQVVVEKEDEPYAEQVSESKEVEGDYEVTYNKTDYIKNNQGKGVCIHDSCDTAQLPKPEPTKIEISRTKVIVKDVTYCPDPEEVEEGFSYWYYENDVWRMCD